MIDETITHEKQFLKADDGWYINKTVWNVYEQKLSIVSFKHTDKDTVCILNFQTPLLSYNKQS